MKRFLLSCCILAVTSTMVFAQASKTVAKTKTTKAAATKTKTVDVNNFTSKVNLFEAGVNRDRMELAKQNFEDLKGIMTDDLQSYKPRIYGSTNEKEKKQLTDEMSKKQKIYFDIIHSASDMKGNGTKMVQLYRQYQGML